MNISQIKSIPIPKVLAYFGKQPAFIKGSNVWYYALNRTENSPSLKVDIKKNLYIDFGIHRGGSVVDLVMEIKGYREVGEALNFLGGFEGPDADFSKIEVRSRIVKHEEIETVISRIGNIKNRNLINYAKSRKLDLSILQKYCSEVHYEVGTSKWYSIGFKNDSGGYVFRNKYMKRAYSSSDITQIKNNCNRLIIFEGFMDFLSYLTVYSDKELKYDFIILNSTSNKQKIDQNILGKYRQTYLFLDNDSNGVETAKFFFSLNENVLDCSMLYKSFNDLNDWLVHRIKGDVAPRKN